MIVLSWIITGLFIAASSHITLFSLVQLQLLFYAGKRHLTLFPKMRKNNLPYVTVQLPVYNEKYVIKRLIETICQLDYPINKLEIQILDDSTDETSDIITQTIASFPQLDLVHIRRMNRSGYKAGALQHATPLAKGELLAIFDADFRPDPDFLLKTVPFFQNKAVGALQTRWGHLNEDYSALTKLQSILLNNHFIIEQSGRYNAGFMLQFNGTAGLWRKKTIAEVGGWQADTLTEDLDLSYRAQLADWKIVFLNNVVCPAEIPTDLKALKVQQFRWMQGGAQNARKHLRSIWQSEFSLMKKLHASLHLFSSLAFFSILLTALLSIPMLYILEILGINKAFLGLFSIGLLLNGLVFFYANYYTGWIHLPKHRRVLRFVKMFPLLMLYCMGLAFHNTVAVAKGLIGINTPFYRTPKYGSGDVGQTEEKKANYKTLPLSFMAKAELMLILYFIMGIALAFYTHYFSFLLYNIILVIAYTVVSVQSREWGKL